MSISESYTCLESMTCRLPATCYLLCLSMSSALDDSSISHIARCVLMRATLESTLCLRRSHELFTTIFSFPIRLDRLSSDVLDIMNSVRDR